MMRACGNVSRTARFQAATATTRTAKHQPQARAAIGGVPCSDGQSPLTKARAARHAVAADCAAACAVRSAALRAHGPPVVFTNGRAGWHGRAARVGWWTADAALSDLIWSSSFCTSSLRCDSIAESCKRPQAPQASEAAAGTACHPAAMLPASMLRLECAAPRAGCHQEL